MESGILEFGIQFKESEIPLKIGIQNISSIDKESAIQFLESKTVLYYKSAWWQPWPAEYHKTSAQSANARRGQWSIVMRMPASNLRLLKKLLLQRFQLKIGLPVLQIKGLTRMALDGEGLQSKVTLKVKWSLENDLGEDLLNKDELFFCPHINAKTSTLRILFIF